MSLRQIIEDAASQLATYRNPSVSEAQERLNELLEAAELGGITHDRIESIDEVDGVFRIATTWVIRGCESGHTYELPSFIVDAEDPVAAATKWGLEQKIAEANEAVDKALRQLTTAAHKLAQLQAKAHGTMPIAPIDNERAEQWRQAALAFERRAMRGETTLRQIASIEIVRGMDCAEAIERGIAAVGYAQRAVGTQPAQMPLYERVLGLPTTVFPKALVGEVLGGAYYRAADIRVLLTDGSFDDAETLQKRIGECEDALAAQERVANAFQSDARRYEYVLDCEVIAAKKYLPQLDVAEFKTKRRAKHDEGIASGVTSEGGKA